MSVCLAGKLDLVFLILMVVHWLVLPALTPNCTHLVPLIEQVFFGFHLLSCECVQSFLSNLGQLIIFFDLRR